MSKITLTGISEAVALLWSAPSRDTGPLTATEDDNGVVTLSDSRGAMVMQMHRSTYDQLAGAFEEGAATGANASEGASISSGAGGKK